MSEELEQQTVTPAEGAESPGEAVIVDEATDEVLRVHLDQFEGPMEVLLYLIRVQKV